MDSKESNGKELPKQIIEIKDFVPMAACIASSSSSIKISKGFLNLIKRCIMARSSTTDWYASNAATDSQDDMDNVEKHSHFTSVLEQVLRTLMTRFSANGADVGGHKIPKAQSGPHPIGDANRAPLANLFELLAVEDTDGDIDQGDEVPAVGSDTRGPEPSSEPPKVRYEIGHDDADVEEEWFFALHLFFCDLHYLKLVLEELWERYRDREIDLTVSPVATNTAFDLVRRAEMDFLCEMPIPKKYAQYTNGADLCYLNYIDVSVRKGCGTSDTEGPKELFDFRRYDDVEHCFLVPYLCLKQFDREVKERNGSIPMMSIEEARQLVIGPRSELTPREKHKEDVTILMSSVAVIASFVSVSNAPSEDEFCAGIRELIKQHKFPLCGSFLPLKTTLMCTTSSGAESAADSKSFK